MTGNAQATALRRLLERDDEKGGERRDERLRTENGRTSAGRAIRFLKAFLDAPGRIGSIVPSSATLSCNLAECAMSAWKGGIVLELGPGTGPITEALIDAGLPPEALVTVERHPDLHASLRRRVPGARHELGDAADAANFLSGRLPDAIVSGLPFLSLPEDVRRSVISGIFPLLSEGSPLIQFTYAPGRPPIPRSALPEPEGWKVAPIRRILRNVPPATIWSYERKQD
jgi:phosphatidylethanolamine/phosphatidyl-N-methylethanolamine N-methyltransferase